MEKLKRSLKRRILRAAEFSETNWRSYPLPLLVSLALFWCSLHFEGETEVLFATLYLCLAIFGAVFWGRGAGILLALLTSFSLDFHYVHPKHESVFSLDGLLLFGAVLVLTNLMLFLIETLRQGTRETVDARVKAETSARELRDTLDCVSHDMRQPITALSLNLQLLGRGTLKQASEKETKELARAVHLLEVLASLVDNILDSGKGELRQDTDRRERVGLGPLARGVFEDLKPIMSQKAIAFSVEDADSLPMVLADRTQLTRVFWNLLGNAVKFVPFGGWIKVSMEACKSGSVLVRISDSGPGVPEHLQKHLFQKRQQASDTAHLGHGLGLFICDQIIRSHGGSIWYGKNSGFCVLLPIPAPNLREALLQKGLREFDAGGAPSEQTM